MNLIYLWLFIFCNYYAYLLHKLASCSTHAHTYIHTNAHKYVDVYGKNAQVLIYSFSKMGFDEQLAY